MISRLSEKLAADGVKNFNIAGVGYESCAEKPLSDPSSDTWIEFPKFLRRGDD